MRRSTFESLRRGAAGAPRVALLIFSPIVAAGAFWALFAACVDTPLPQPPPAVRLVASWPPASCGRPHRVVLAVEDDAGVEEAASVPCELGGLVLELPHLGTYHGAFRHEPEEVPPRAPASLDLLLDRPEVFWRLPAAP